MKHITMEMEVWLVVGMIVLMAFFLTSNAKADCVEAARRAKGGNKPAPEAVLDWVKEHTLNGFSVTHTSRRQHVSKSTPKISLAMIFGGRVWFTEKITGPIPEGDAEDKPKDLPPLRSFFIDRLHQADRAPASISGARVSDREPSGPTVGLTLAIDLD